MVKKILSFFGICAYVLGVLGGLGYCIAAGAWVIAAAVVILGVMAFPTARQFFKDLQA